MNIIFRLLNLSFLLLLFGCGDSQSPGPEGEEEGVSKAAPYIESLSEDDIDGIRKRGVLRLLAPLTDENTLNYKGLPATAYRQLAEDFAQSLGLKAQWIYSAEYDQLIPSLNGGRADLIITNLSVTRARQQQVDFSTAIKSTNEILIRPKSDDGHNGALDSTAIAVPKGTAYEESLQALIKKYPDLIINTVDSRLRDSDMLDGVAQGIYPATVIDGDTAEVMLRDYPSLITGPVINEYRQIAWAVRKNNPQLRSLLNQFLVQTHISDGSFEVTRHDWAGIKKSGILRLLTTNAPNTYFLWRGEHMGFDYALVKKFADDNQLQLAIIVKNSLQDLRAALNAGEGDLVAASITDIETRQTADYIFTQPYLKVTEQLIASTESADDIIEIADLDNRVIAINPEKSYAQTLEKIQQSGVNIHRIDVENASTEDLINAVSEGKYPYTIADSHLAAIEQTYRDDISVVLDLSEQRNIAFVLRADQLQLKSRLDLFIKKEYRGLFYNMTFNRYFKSSRRIKSHQQQRVVAGEALSPFDDLVKTYADRYSLDWRLITAQMYQESKFNPKAVSFVGALGLMQVMPRTGEELGYSNLAHPETGIAAGTKYLDWLQHRFPDDIPLDQRIYFTLAAYNAGAGHVRDARRLAKRLGMSPNQWFGHVEKAMLLLSKPKYSRQAQYGYVRGSEPVNYVKSIRDRYLGYLVTH